MKSTEDRIIEFLRENMTTFQKQLDSQKAELTDLKINFGKKVDNYQSEVLWRIQNAEEMIRKCVPEQRVKDINETHQNAVSLLIADNDKIMQERLQEFQESSSLRIKSNEKYTTDKFMETVKYLHEVEQKVNKMATLSMIETLQYADKDLKNKFNTEFEQF